MLLPSDAKNMAAAHCSAKVVAASKAAHNTQAMLNENRDDYLYIPCSEPLWYAYTARHFSTTVSSGGREGGGERECVCVCVCE